MSLIVIVGVIWWMAAVTAEYQHAVKEIDRKAENSEKLIARLDERMTSVEHRLTRVEVRLDRLEVKVDRIEVKLDRLIEVLLAGRSKSGK